MKYSLIKLNDIANTPNGITLSLWTQFCPHHCKNCFNPETWSLNDGTEFNKESYDYICKNINNNGVNRSLSILGGEPLSKPNIDGVIKLCKQFKNDFPEKDIYLWTGYTYEELDDKQKEILPYLTLLIDGLFEQDKKDLSLMLRGSKNQRVIDVQETLNQKEIVLYCK